MARSCQFDMPAKLELPAAHHLEGLQAALVHLIPRLGGLLEADVNRLQQSLGFIAKAKALQSAASLVM